MTMPVLSGLLPWRTRWGGGGVGGGAGLRWVMARPGRMLAGVALVLALVAAGEHRAAGRWAQKARDTQAAWDADRAQAIAATLAAETRYRSLAHDADLNRARIAEDGDKRLAIYLDAHRVRPGAQADPARAGEGGGAGVSAKPAAAPELAPVVVSEADVHTCDADYAYARAAYEWARGL